MENQGKVGCVGQELGQKIWARKKQVIRVQGKYFEVPRCLSWIGHKPILCISEEQSKGSDLAPNE